MHDLSGVTVLLTGASDGIGFHTARLLGERGANLIAHWRSNEQGALKATEDIPADRKLLIQADFSADGGARRLWESALQWRGRVDVLVNNAGLLPQAGIDSNDEEWAASWETAMEVNVVQPANLMRLATQHFLTRGSGVLITMSSWAAQQGSGNPKLVAYAASKAALAAATKTVARAHASAGVLAYCIAPGAVATGMTLQSANNQGGLAEVTAALAMREMVPPGEVAELVAILATGRHRHLSGATIDVNGATYLR